MAKPTNLYRRGAVYWWRRRLNFAVPEKFPITLSLSLFTKELSMARTRGAAMTMVSERLRMTMHQQLLSGTLSAAQAKTIYQNAVRQMGSALLEMTGGLTLDSSPEFPTSDRALVIVKEFWHSAAGAGIREAPDWTFADKNWPALDLEEKRHLIFAARTTGVKQKFETDVVAALVAVGTDPTARNQAIAAKLIAEARAVAARDALEPGWISRWMESGGETDAVPASTGISSDRLQDDGFQVVDVHHAVEDPFFLEPPCGAENPRLDRLMRTPAPAIDDPFAGSKPNDRKLLEMTPVQLAEEFIEQKVGFFDHREGGKRASKSTVEHTKRQIICAARLLQQALPVGTPFSLVTAKQVKDFDSLLDHIPLSFGKAPNDHSLTLQLTDVAERTAIRVAKAEISLDDVGLSIPTSNKHFRYLQRLRNEVEKLCSELPIVSYAKYCQPDLKKDRDARVEYSVEQGRAIFSLPPWTGCFAIEERLEKGAAIIHDALFWVLLLVWYTGARREEICALRLINVRSEHGIDYLLISDGKTENALRHIPIATELKRLGFLSFVTAMRQAGEHLLFPEIQPGRGKRTLGDVFYKLWWIYLKPMIPGLVRGQAMHSCRHMVSTELKDLQVFPEFRNDLLGHSGGTGGEGVIRYPKATRLNRLQVLVDSIPIVTDDLPSFSGELRLLPAELRVPRPIRETVAKA